MASPYKVIPLPRAKDDFLHLHAEFKSRGRENEFMRSALSIAQRLQTDPASFGEVLFHLRAGHAFHLASIRPLIVRFAVFEEAKTVVIQSYLGLS